MRLQAGDPKFYLKEAKSDEYMADNTDHCDRGAAFRRGRMGIQQTGKISVVSSLHRGAHGQGQSKYALAMGPSALSPLGRRASNTTEVFGRHVRFVPGKMRGI